jgi:signal transduction histidine kinase
VTIEEDYDETLEKLLVSPQEISRVILNLTNNACYAAHQKALGIGAEFRPTIAITTQNLEDSIQISVRDNGDGIPESVRERIFTPFFTYQTFGRRHLA